MGRLVTDLLALARAPNDTTMLALELMDLREIARQAMDGILPLAEAKDQHLEVDLPGALLVRGDAPKLRQVLSNLLENAVAYTPVRGAVTVRGRYDHGQARVQVRDTGVGIAPEHLPRLFEPFYQVDRARSGGSGHMGLGLALAAGIAHAHRGRLAVESQVGVGSVFTLTLPAVVA